ncbi:HET domain-containing protein [Ophiostoma piceae UAMH 11346]|uniref:HET domain-containing protein n=1 Tax=Ophiostoma piceae (strain UAMH 11346) TaxID=1262450 RepID=S3BWB7_OPHP1|nr:HET domain-containing protein [Ophiostoma piceae UAMH 11346]
MASTAAGDDGRPLCGQCRLLLSTDTLGDQEARGGFKHSLLGSFGHRPDCRLCHYLWNENWVGASVTPQSVRRLRDLLEPQPNAARLQNASRFRTSWVVFAFNVSISQAARDELPNPSEPSFHFLWDASAETFTFLPSQNVTIGLESVNVILRIRLEDDRGRMLWAPFNGLDLVTTADSKCTKLTRLRQIDWSDHITQWISVVRALLDDCQLSHDRCKPIRPELLPPRLLQVQAGQSSLTRVALRATPRQSDRGRYAALSYCWGGPQKLQLTKSNFDALQKGIDAAALPQTLRDAVLVTQLLGLEYLWVDALCIIQDDDADKAAQLIKMHTIYENSAVTIAAAAASSVGQGFLSFDSVRNKKYPACDVAVRFADSHIGALSLVPVQYHMSDRFAINKRGWTLQEAIIPPRLLVFGDLEPFLRCRTKDFVHARQSPVRFYSSIQPQRFFTDADDTTWTRSDRFDKAWPEIVSQYTMRELGFIADRPLAIGGVTDYLAALFDDQCHFGIWKARALECLLWKVTHGGGRPSGFLADYPTWSWMSAYGRVDLDTMNQYRSPEATVEWNHGPEHEQLTVECRALPLADVTTKNIIESWPDTITGDVGTDEYVSIDNECWGGNVVFLIVSRTVNNHFMAIAAIPDEGAYERVGLAELRHVATWAHTAKAKCILY